MTSRESVEYDYIRDFVELEAEKRLNIMIKNGKLVEKEKRFLQEPENKGVYNEINS